MTNHMLCREALKSCKPPAIPYLGLFPKDLTAVEEGNENLTLDVCGVRGGGEKRG